MFRLQISRRRQSLVFDDPIHSADADATKLDSRKFRCRALSGDVNWA